MSDQLTGGKRTKLDHYLKADIHLRIGTMAEAFGMTRKEIIDRCLEDGLASNEVLAVAQLIAEDRNVGVEVTPSQTISFLGGSPENDGGAMAEYEALADRLRGIQDNREYALEIRAFVFERTAKRKEEEEQRRRLF